MSGKGQHVIPSGSQWAVRRAGASRSSGVYQTMNEAVDAARTIARNQGSELYIHGRDGRITDRESFAERGASAKK